MQLYYVTYHAYSKWNYNVSFFPVFFIICTFSYSVIHFFTKPYITGCWFDISYSLSILLAMLIFLSKRSRVVYAWYPKGIKQEHDNVLTFANLEPGEKNDAFD